MVDDTDLRKARGAAIAYILQIRNETKLSDAIFDGLKLIGENSIQKFVKESPEGIMSLELELAFCSYVLGGHIPLPDALLQLKGDGAHRHIRIMVSILTNLGEYPTNQVSEYLENVPLTVPQGIERFCRVVLAYR